MKERPILFSAPMVRALLAGTKTQTRRLLKLPSFDGITSIIPSSGADNLWDSINEAWPEPDPRRWRYHSIECPYGVPGDRLWVRESGWSWFEDYYPDEFDDCQDRAEMFRWAASPRHGKRCWLTGEREGTVEPITYLDDSTPLEMAPKGKPTPSIHMPRWASRIALELTDVRVQRLQELSEDDARAEGVEPYRPAEGDGGAKEGPAWFRMGYRDLWDEINRKRAPWNSDPFVWALTFRRVAA